VSLSVLVGFRRKWPDPFRHCHRDRRTLARFGAARMLGLVLVLGVLAGPIVAHAGDWFAPLSGKDVALMAVDTGLLAIDWGQSRYIAVHPDGFHEINPLVGHHPCENTVNAHFAAAVPAYWFSAWMLPPKEATGYKRIVNREYFSIAMGVIEGANVGRNASMGIKLRW